jgi:XTP/dITP diphosphohydrolase
MKTVVVLATSNPGKVTEFERLAPESVEFRLTGDFGIALPPETGKSFEENALLKAKAASRATGLIAVGDDSGLEVDALDGLPGVRSARYAGDHASDRQNIEKLLSAMREVPGGERSATFRCTIALVLPSGESHVVEGSIAGTIASSPRGTNGFGYDPVFVIDDGRTFAELSPAEKNSMSHRSEAMRALEPELKAVLDLLVKRYTGAS